MSNMRIEKDGLGEMPVPAERLWGAVTERSRLNFPIGNEAIPPEIIRSLIQIKLAAARTNVALGVLDQERGTAIETICEALLNDDPRREEFPLKVWQTGSGTQTNMNVNEVIANLGNKEHGKGFLHPNDHVNLSQSSNDTFPTAMHVATRLKLEPLFAALRALIEAFEHLSKEHQDTLKLGRTHLQDAVPITFGQEVSGWLTALKHNLDHLESAAKGLDYIALGGTAVGTGLNTPEGYAERVADELSEVTGHHFHTADNKFTSLSFQTQIATVHSALKNLAMDLHKIANDIRLLNSGPRAGIGEIQLPANEPGSSIMPGKVNPTQCEALTMIAAQVLGNDTTISFAASQGQFQLNVYLPVMAYNILQSIGLLTDGMESFRLRAVEGLEVKSQKMLDSVKHSLMLTTALTPELGYLKAADIAKYAEKKNLSLREATLELGYLSAKEFDEIVQPRKMV